MKEILKVALKNRNVISLCIGKINWERRIIGYVKSMSKDNILFHLIDIFGTTIKEKSINIASISVLEINDSYNKHLEKLKEQGKFIKATKSLYYYNKGDDFQRRLKTLISEATVCTIFFGTEYLTGVIKGIMEETLVIKSIGYKGSNEGESYCKLKNVSRVRYDGPLERKISYLKSL